MASKSGFLLGSDQKMEHTVTTNFVLDLCQKNWKES